MSEGEHRIPAPVKTSGRIHGGLLVPPSSIQGRADLERGFCPKQKHKSQQL